MAAGAGLEGVAELGVVTGAFGHELHDPAFAGRVEKGDAVADALGTEFDQGRMTDEEVQGPLEEGQEKKDGEEIDGYDLDGFFHGRR
jgi:hypothetical protein